MWASLYVFMVALCGGPGGWRSTKGVPDEAPAAQATDGTVPYGVPIFLGVCMGAILVHIWIRMIKKERAWGRGATLVEMAVVFPLLLMVTLGAIKYGWLFLKAQQMTNAARTGGAHGHPSRCGRDRGEHGHHKPAGWCRHYDIHVGPPLSVAGPIVTVGIRVDPTTVDLIPGYLPNPSSLYVRVTMAKEGMPTGPITP